MFFCYLLRNWAITTSAWCTTEIWTHASGTLSFQVLYHPSTILSQCFLMPCCQGQTSLAKLWFMPLGVNYPHIIPEQDPQEGDVTPDNQLPLLAGEIVLLQIESGDSAWKGKVSYTNSSSGGASGRVVERGWAGEVWILGWTWAFFCTVVLLIYSRWGSGFFKRVTEWCVLSLLLLSCFLSSSTIVKLINCDRKMYQEKRNPKRSRQMALIKKIPNKRPLG